MLEVRKMADEWMRNMELPTEKRKGLISLIRCTAERTREECSKAYIQYKNRDADGANVADIMHSTRWEDENIPEKDI